MIKRERDRDRDRDRDREGAVQMQVFESGGGIVLEGCKSAMREATLRPQVATRTTHWQLCDAEGSISCKMSLTCGHLMMAT